MDRKLVSLSSLCDLSKASDNVNHTILLKKFENINVDTFWFENYYYEKTQSVRINNSITSTLPVMYGVPQGSILGTKLFNICVNDMSDDVNDCILLQYTDDTQFLHSSTINNIDNNVVFK